MPVPLPDAGRGPAKYLSKALLGYAMETLLSGDAAGETVRISSPWDVWWTCYRAATPVNRIGVRVELPHRACADCAADALALASASPPQHPDAAGTRSCGCLWEWAVRMRAPAAGVAWPRLSLTLALLKPGAPRLEIRAELERTHEVLRSLQTVLGTEDTRRLYPEAYGADYVAARDAYLTGGPVHALILRARDASGPGHKSSAKHIKARIRQTLGADLLRNHLHMPDNPGEALADIAHLAGEAALTDLYERHDRDGAPDRLAFYRAALGISSPDTHRQRTAG